MKSVTYNNGIDYALYWHSKRIFSVQRQEPKPMKLNKFISFLSLFAIVSVAHAGPILVDFQDMADNSYGETAWQPLSLNPLGVNVDVTGRYDGQTVYAYLDSKSYNGFYRKDEPGGLGVCRDLIDDSKLNPTSLPVTGGVNNCNPGDDDNANTVNGKAETLRFLFNEGLTVTKIWFNNNHDPDYGLNGDTVVIGGMTHTFDASEFYSEQRGWLFEFTGTDGIFSAGNMLDISSYVCADKWSTNCDCLRGEEFYISAIEFSKVPEPAMLPLFGIGLLGIFGAGSLKRRRSAAAS